MVSDAWFSRRTGTILTGLITAILWVEFLYAITVDDSYQKILKDYFDYPAAYIMTALCCLTGAVVSVLLVVGALEKNTHCMIPWLVMHLAAGIVHFFVIVVICSVSIFTGKIQETLPSVLRALVLFLVMGAWAGVYQYYEQLISRITEPLTAINIVSGISEKSNETKEKDFAAKEISIKG